MIGNDVIDLQQSRQESNWQRKGFLEKLFSEEEQCFIANSSDPEIIIWLMWSMKEAAYKILNRQTKKREFIPKKLICKILSQTCFSATGQVFYIGNIYHTRTFLADDFIHTIAVNDLEDLDLVVEIDKKEMLKDINGIPWLCITNSNQYKAASNSNHGRFEKTVTIKSK
ncbi:4'-phosphopantetheinyl transferase family protein [Sphingobacterium anhuiense]|uniref:4'-phosphopantetheinyl transferase superfamily protein n=1 Tax=Sphingobacterium anhuiense TaxID=493780 RepID=A0ABW5YUP2_9SPHI